jgi:NDP-sugar pyrophosphorylase family protein
MNSELHLAQSYFTLPSHMPFQDFFLPEKPVWEWVEAIQNALQSFDFLHQEGLRNTHPGLVIEGNVFIHPSVKLPPYGVIQGPVWIGPETVLRPGIFIRGNVIVGQKCVLGHSCEYKNALLMDNVETAHFNYVGDSVLGSHAHLGAGAILANLRLDRQSVKVRTPQGRYETHRKKLGAILGEGVDVGCNAVLQPGTLVAKGGRVWPATAAGGFIGEDKTVIKGFG